MHERIYVVSPPKPNQYTEKVRATPYVANTVYTI